MVKHLERKFVKKNENLRDFLFKPILKILNNFNISPNFLSDLKLLAFVPYIFLVKNNIKLAFVFFLISLLLDILDGPLARFQKRSSDRGKFIDTFGDFTIYTIIILSLIYVGIGNKNILTYHLFIFPILVILAILKKNEFVKSDWLVKPAPYIGHFNGLVLSCLFLNIYFGIDYLDLVLILLNVYYSFLSLYYFVFIQHRWLGKYKNL